MRLLVTTPMAVIVDADSVRHVRAEDETGAFGILPGHADFITALAVSVITWRNGTDEEHHVAVRGGVLTVGVRPHPGCCRGSTGRSPAPRSGRSATCRGSLRLARTVSTPAAKSRSSAWRSTRT